MEALERANEQHSKTHREMFDRCDRVPAGEGWPMKSMTRFLFIATQLAALGWVSVSYLIAIYATVRLAQPFPVVELSQQAITTILGVNVLKVVENIFEHNDSPLFGHTKEDT